MKCIFLNNFNIFNEQVYIFIRLCPLCSLKAVPIFCNCMEKSCSTLKMLIFVIYPHEMIVLLNMRSSLDELQGTRHVFQRYSLWAVCSLLHSSQSPVPSSHSITL